MSTMTTEDQTYNGWKNYPTWAVNLWLSNDEGLYRQTTDLVATARSDWLEGAEDEVGRDMRYFVGDAIQAWGGTISFQPSTTTPRSSLTSSATRSARSTGVRSRTPGSRRRTKRKPCGLRPFLGRFPECYRTSPRTERTGGAMRYYAVRALWACADTLDIVRDGLIVLASKVVPR